MSTTEWRLSPSKVFVVTEPDGDDVDGVLNDAITRNVTWGPGPWPGAAKYPGQVLGRVWFLIHAAAAVRPGNGAPVDWWVLSQLPAERIGPEGAQHDWLGRPDQVTTDPLGKVRAVAYLPDGRLCVKALG